MKKIENFRLFVNKVLPTVYDDSLSYYELLTKVVEYLNNAIGQVNALTKGFSEVLDVVVPENVEAVLDKWYLDGTLDTVINIQLLANKADKDVTDQKFNDHLAILNKLLNQTDPTKKYKVVGCVLRSSGPPDYWKQIPGSHASININDALINTNADHIVIPFTFTAKNVVTFVVTPDETFAQEGLFCGASVSDTYALIKMYQNKSLDFFIDWDTTLNEYKLGPDSSPGTLSYSEGILTITHSGITGNDVQVSSRGGATLPAVGSTSQTTTQVFFTDYNGQMITTPGFTTRAFVKRTSKKIVDPMTFWHTSGNLWCYGIMEVE